MKPESELGSQSVEPKYGARVLSLGVEPEFGARVGAVEPESELWSQSG